MTLGKIWTRLALLGHVHRVLEADHGEECKSCGRCDRAEQALALRRLQLRHL